MTDPSPGAGEDKPPTSENYTRLTPLAGVKLAWALTGGFQKPKVVIQSISDSTNKEVAEEKHGDKDIITQNTDEAEKMLEKSIKTFPTSLYDEERHETEQREAEYVQESSTAIRVAVRNLATIYRGRDLNFQENDVLRKVHLNSIEEDLTLGSNLRDFTRALPSAVLAGGSGTVLSFISMRYLGAHIDTIDILFFSIIAAVIGILLYTVILKITRWREKRFLIQSDHERNIFYRQYLYRSQKELEELYRELNGIYNNKFSPKIDPDCKEGNKEIKLMLKPLCPTECTKADRCIYRWFYDVKSWISCETWKIYEENQKNSAPENETKCPFKPEFKERLHPILFLFGLALIVLVFIFVISLIFPVPSPARVELTKSLVSFRNDTDRAVEVSVILKNSGSTAISSIFMEDTIPSSFNYTNGEMTKSIISLGPQESASLNYTLRSRYAGHFTLPRASVLFTNGSEYCDMVMSEAPVYDDPIGPPPDNVSISKLVSPAVLGENQTLVVTVTVQNTGKDIIHNITITDQVPDDFIFKTGNLRKNITILKAAESRSLEYTLVSMSAGNYILNPAIAEFTGSGINNTINYTRVESNSPVIQVLSGFNRTALTSECTSNQVPFNMTEAIDQLRKIVNALPFNNSSQ